MAARKTARRSKATGARLAAAIRARTAARENLATRATRAATESRRVNQRGSEKVCARRKLREEDEARRESERSRGRWHEGKGSQVARVLSGKKGEMGWENGKGNGKVSDGGRSGKVARHEGKGWSMVGGERQNVAEDHKTWEDWRPTKEKNWAEREELSGDDLDGGDLVQSLRQEQWEEVRNLMGREAVRMAERLGEELVEQDNVVGK